MDTSHWIFTVTWKSLPYSSHGNWYDCFADEEFHFSVSLWQLDKAEEINESAFPEELNKLSVCALTERLIKNVVCSLQ